MEKSNIIVKSNVYLSEKDDPRFDREFVKQIEDYQLIKDIKNSKEVEPEIAELTKEQKKIITMEMRCAYAKNDPCWGYSKKLERVVCACINGECQNIMKCNPEYSEKEAKYWRRLQQEKKLYGNPDMLLKYYRVDLISEKESLRYKEPLKEESSKYLLVKNKSITGKVEETERRIDSKTGREQIIIGYRWVIIDQAGYENEKLYPIWGFVDELEERRPISRVKVSKVEKRVRNTQLKDEILDQQTHISEKKYEKVIKENVIYRVKLIEVDKSFWKTEKTLIIVANPAEKGYVSDILLKNEISHGYDDSSNIQLIEVDNFNKVTAGELWVSDNVLELFTVQIRNLLSIVQKINLLSVPKKEYYKFRDLNQNERWCIKNMYGVTHVCIEQSDISEIKKEKSDEYSIYLELQNGVYLIVCEETKQIIGKMRKEFTEMLQELEKLEEISEIPLMIKGISILINNDKITILGMGHLIFTGY